MKIKYIGPKVVISHLGISFKEGKEDKYNYLLSSFQILKAIKHEYIKGTLYNFNLENNISDSNILEEVLAIVKDLNSLFYGSPIPLVDSTMVPVKGLIVPIEQKLQKIY